MLPVNRLVFLDFDGVLNSNAYFRRCPEAAGSVSIDKVLVKRLSDFLLRSNCDVVISSTWREGRKLAELRDILLDRGLAESLSSKIVGMTPVLDGDAERGEEILAFLTKKVRGMVPFVIFDDDDDMGSFRSRLVQTDPEVGLSSSDIKKAKKILGI